MLSSTMSTLIGGTEPSNREVAGWGEEVPEDSFFRLMMAAIGLSGLGRRVFLDRAVRCRCGGAPEGVGGWDAFWFVDGASGAGGVGRGGAAGMPLGCASEAVESIRGRVEPRCIICGLMVLGGFTATAPAFGCDKMVGDEVGSRLYFGRLWCLRVVPPGDGRGGIWPVLSTDIDRGWSADPGTSEW